MNDVPEPLMPDELAGALAEALAPLAPAPVRSDAIRRRLLARVHSDREGHRTVRAGEGRWHPVAPGVEVKMLHRDESAQSFLMRLAPGARVPSHAHAADEHCVVLEGSLRIGDLVVSAGDYHLARAGRPHDELVSDTGALLFLRTAPGATLHT